MDNVHKISSFLSQEEVAVINNYLTNENLWASRSERKEDKNLGRVMYMVNLPNDLLQTIKDRVKAIVGRELETINCMFVDYDGKYGQPNLAPHFDGDNNNVIVDYQVKSNTSWGLGVGTTVFDMEDNNAVIFNPNEHPHWRPHKTFKDGEFVTMMFIRFPESGADYSHKRLSQDNAIFDEARKIRDSLV